MATQADKRRQAFNEARDSAIEISNEALRNIDAVLAEEDQLMSGLAWSTEHGFMTQDEADDCLGAYVTNRYGDPFAAPLTNIVEFPGQQ